MTNPLTDDISEMIAETINGLSPGAGASSLRTSFAGLLAQLVNLLEGGSSASALRQSVPQLIARWAAAVGVSPAPSVLTSDPLAMLAAIRNTLSDDPDIGSTRTAVGELWEQALDLTLSDSGGGGGGDGLAWDDADPMAWDDGDLIMWDD